MALSLRCVSMDMPRIVVRGKWRFHEKLPYASTDRILHIDV
ncbi:S-adenosylmethionine tRNA ribosyltransferase [Burkholderia pseudomallei]|nr:S-adenosylmethionine tRNA ribosyltransferase [Burkholderia pseudomallei]